MILCAIDFIKDHGTDTNDLHELGLYVMDLAGNSKGSMEDWGWSNQYKNDIIGHINFRGDATRSR